MPQFFSHLQNLKVYGEDVPIVKEECVNHIAKRLRTGLRNVVKTCKAQVKTGTLNVLKVTNSWCFYNRALAKGETPGPPCKKSGYLQYHHWKTFNENNKGKRQKKSIAGEEETAECKVHKTPPTAKGCINSQAGLVQQRGDLSTRVSGTGRPGAKLLAVCGQTTTARELLCTAYTYRCESIEIRGTDSITPLIVGPTTLPLERQDKTCFGLSYSAVNSCRPCHNHHDCSPRNQQTSPRQTHLHRRWLCVREFANTSDKPRRGTTIGNPGAPHGKHAPRHPTSQRVPPSALTKPARPRQPYNTVASRPPLATRKQAPRLLALPINGHEPLGSTPGHTRTTKNKAQTGLSAILGNGISRPSRPAGPGHAPRRAPPRPHTPSAPPCSALHGPPTCPPCPQPSAQSHTPAVSSPPCRPPSPPLSLPPARPLAPGPPHPPRPPPPVSLPHSSPGRPRSPAPPGTIFRPLPPAPHPPPSFPPFFSTYPPALPPQFPLLSPYCTKHRLSR
ncbi:proline-rich protein 36-like [Homalodisca vitripennis]|uniref:proline-rich protein 36-like n=1 Tax=Homalodisca vitripennis TaxID=197043 RepID=UPI001EEAEBDF|nr:proline-rich protein 36-like [Homalodisca vitripennis]